MRVLVVDDVPDMREILERFIEVFGFEVVSAGSGNQGLAIFKEQDIDLIITDISMDDGDGFELAQGARDIDSEIKIIFITGYEVDDARQRATELGAQGFLAKPFSIRELKSLIDQLFQTEPHPPLHPSAGEPAV